MRKLKWWLHLAVLLFAGVAISTLESRFTLIAPVANWWFIFLFIALLISFLAVQAYRVNLKYKELLFFIAIILWVLSFSSARYTLCSKLGGTINILTSGERCYLNADLLGF
ncbi:MAG: hypothetical protein JWL82_569 [Parcubacteria group bacterium]|nr:hypothetical protein [Parcubacteria group bacterium]